MRSSPTALPVHLDFTMPTASLSTLYVCTCAPLKLNSLELNLCGPCQAGELNDETAWSLEVTQHGPHGTQPVAAETNNMRPDLRLS